MKKIVLQLLMVLATALSATTAFAQIKNKKTETVRVSGNCDMCKQTIENAARKKKVAEVVWNKNSKTAELSYDSTKTTKDELLKHIALAGYDNESYLAPNETYAQLPECCKYNRTLKPTEKTIPSSHNNHEKNNQKTSHAANQPTSTELDAVFNHYFFIKDALVQSNGVNAAKSASELLNLIKKVDASKLTTNAQEVWKDLLPKVNSNLNEIVSLKDIAQQRAGFSQLSNHLYAVAKVAKLKTVVYYQFCPMYNSNKGAYWLSTTQAIKNPYYGSQMLTCGSTKETIHN